MRGRDQHPGIGLCGRRPALPVLSRQPGEPEDHALGRSRGGFGTKLHLLTCGNGVVLSASLTPGEAAESMQLDDLLSGVRAGQRRRGEAVVCDKGYDSPRCREAVRRRGMKCVIPQKSLPKGKHRRRRGRPPWFDHELYRRRNIIERRARGLKRPFDSI